MCHYKLIVMNHVTTSTSDIIHRLHFMLLAYNTQQIFLPHCKYRSHCLPLYWLIHTTVEHLYAKTQLTTMSDSHVIAIYVPEIHITAKFHVYHIFDGHIWKVCVYISLKMWLGHGINSKKWLITIFLNTGNM